MALTWRDLALPNRAEVWRELRGLRSSVTGPANTVPERKAVFVAALEQAQQFIEAAERAGVATRPVQIFYSLSQFGRAIAAASCNLEGEDEEWRLKGHGIGTSMLDVSQGLASVQVVPHKNGSIKGVAKALGVAPLAAGIPLALGEIWSLIPESRRAPLPIPASLPALSVTTVTRVHREARTWHRIIVSPIPVYVYDNSSSDRSVIQAFLGRYPDLAKWADDPFAPEVTSWEGGGKLNIYIPSSLAPGSAQEDFEEEARRIGTIYRGPDDRYVFPGLAEQDRPVHPLLAWWGLLFGLSILARYEPESWAKVIDIDESLSANAVEHILDQALDVIPHISLLAIKEVSGASHY